MNREQLIEIAERCFEGFCCIMSALAGAFLLWLGGSAMIVAALCWFMAGGFFVRASMEKGE